MGSNGESGEESGDSASRPPTSATATPPTSQNPINLTFVTEQHDQATPGSGEGSEQQQEHPHLELPFEAIRNDLQLLMGIGRPETGAASESNEGGSSASAETSQTGERSTNINNNNTRKFIERKTNILQLEFACLREIFALFIYILKLKILK